MDKKKSNIFIRLSQLMTRILSAVSQGLFVISAAIVFLIMAIVCIAVLMRYFFHLSVGWSTELTEYLIYLIVMFGTPWVLKNNGHVQVDIVTNMVSKRVERHLSLFTNLIGLIVCGAFFYYGSLAFHENFVKGTLMVKIMPIPKWVPILFIPVMAFFTGFQFLMKVITSIWLDKDDQQESTEIVDSNN